MALKAIQVSSPGGDFELVQKEIPRPLENEVLIKVEACGVCHGDAIVKEGRFPGLQYPRVPGHEVVGIIDQLGTKSKHWKVGQRVGVGWLGGYCFQCAACRSGEFGACEEGLTTGISTDGGYAGEMMQLSPVALMRGGRSIRGWVGGRPEDAIRFSILTGVRPMVEVFSLEQAPLAYNKMMSEKVHFREVLKIA